MGYDRLASRVTGRLKALVQPCLLLRLDATINDARHLAVLRPNEGDPPGEAPIWRASQKVSAMGSRTLHQSPRNFGQFFRQELDACHFSDAETVRSTRGRTAESRCAVPRSQKPGY